MPDKISINDFDAMAAAAEIFLERYYKAKKKLESFHSPASPKRGRGLSEKEAVKMLAKRRKNINNRKFTPQ